jgi:hypothetical protein
MAYSPTGSAADAIQGGPVGRRDSRNGDLAIAGARSGCDHFYKYRLYYGRDGVRLVGYDNERPKGDHRHIDGVETTYKFASVDRLVEDFLSTVRARRAKR